MKPHQYKFALLLAALLVLGVALWAVFGMERTVRHGQSVLIELAPVDPRSLMQGDYMALAYTVNRQARKMQPWTESMPASSGVFVLQADARGVHQLVAIQPDGEPPTQGHIAMRWRLHAHAPVIGVDSYFFPEGQAAHFAQARYGEYRVSPAGQALLLRLLDADLQPL